jgi:hypothetical protein
VKNKINNDKKKVFCDTTYIEDTISITQDSLPMNRLNTLIYLRHWGTMWGFKAPDSVIVHNSPKQSRAFADSLIRMIGDYCPELDKLEINIDLTPVIEKMDNVEIQKENFSFTERMQYFLWYVSWNVEPDYKFSKNLDTVFLQYSYYNQGIDWGDEIPCNIKNAVRFLKQYAFKYYNQTKFFKVRKITYINSRQNDSMKIKEIHYSYKII